MSDRHSQHDKRNGNGQVVQKPGMEINLDRSKRVVGTLMYWVIVLGVGTVLTVMLYRFTRSIWVAGGLTVGMLTFMLVSSAVMGRNMGGPGRR